MLIFAFQSVVVGSVYPQRMAFTHSFLTGIMRLLKLTSLPTATATTNDQTVAPACVAILTKDQEDTFDNSY